MTKPLAYPSDHDADIQREARFQLGEREVWLSAATVAGRALPGGPQKPNEDAFSVLMDDNLLRLAVFDGSSSQKPIAALGDTTGARFASHLLREEFEQGLGKDPGQDLRELNHRLWQKVKTFRGASLEDVHTLPASTATLVYVDAATGTVRIGHVGDTWCLVQFKDGRCELVTLDRNRPYDEKILKQVLAIAKEQNITPREAKQDPQIKQAVMAMFQDSFNRPDGTGQGIVNGDPQLTQYVQELQLPLNEVAALVIGSDGAVPPDWDEAQPADQRQLVELARTHGAPGLLERKRAVEDADPDWQLVRFKHSDDGTAVVVQF